MSEAARDLLIAIPFYKNPHLVEAVLAPLLADAAMLRDERAVLALYNDSPDDAGLTDALIAAAAQLDGVLPAHIETNPRNLGFVQTMNRAIARAVAERRDLLLLNSDVVVEPGCITEMRAVMAGDPSIGFVNPRSNNATIATLPLDETLLEAPVAARKAGYAALTALLPRLSYAPTNVGFCMLVRWEILAELGGFDEVYGAGYNEENDLVMRASRLGWRAVFANHAFAWHEGESSFAASSVSRNEWEAKNRAILDARYPEYGPLTQIFWDQPETVAERLLAASLPGADGRRSLGFDFSSFRPDHNGTHAAGRQLLQAAAALAEHWDVYVICSEQVYAFHDYASLGVQRAGPHDARLYAAIFRVGQPYDWNVLQRLCLRAAVIGVYMLDTISIDCPQLTSPRLYNMWDFTLQHIDVLVGQSAQTVAMFERRFAIPEHVTRLVSYHPLNLADYVLPQPDVPVARDRSLLVVGNHFHHKYLSATANALAEAFPERPVVALGQGMDHARTGHDPRATRPLAELPNLRGIRAGLIEEREIGGMYMAADVIVFPSFAEGFGFPLLNALAMGRPVFVRRLPVFEELWHKLGRTPNVHFYDTTAELIEALRVPPVFVPNGEPALADEGAARSLAEIIAALEASLRRVAHGPIARRVRAMQFASDSLDPPSFSISGGLPEIPAHRAARRAGRAVEYVAQRVFAARIVYVLSRGSFLALRRVVRAVRGVR